MHLMRESWTDTRLDGLNEKVDRGFASIDARFEKVDERFDKVDERFEKVDERFDKVDERFERLEARFDAKFDALYRLMFQGFIAISAAMIGGFATCSPQSSGPRLSRPFETGCPASFL